MIYPRTYVGSTILFAYIDRLPEQIIGRSVSDWFREYLCVTVFDVRREIFFKRNLPLRRVFLVFIYPLRGEVGFNYALQRLPVRVVVGDRALLLEE